MQSCCHSCTRAHVCWRGSSGYHRSAAISMQPFAGTRLTDNLIRNVDQRSDLTIFFLNNQCTTYWGNQVRKCVTFEIQILSKKIQISGF